jgi:hypothetical protein
VDNEQQTQPDDHDVWVLREVLAYLRIGKSKWYQLAAAGKAPVAHIKDLPGRFHRDEVYAAARRAACGPSPRQLERARRDRERRRRLRAALPGAAGSADATVNTETTAANESGPRQ